VVAVAVLLWVVVLVVAGMSMLRLLRTPGPAGELLLLAAPVGFGVSFVAASLAARAGLPVLPVAAVALAALGVAWLTVEVVGLRSGRRGASRSEVDAARRTGSAATLCSRVLLLVAVAAGVVLWAMSHARLTYPAGADSMHHAFFIWRIVHFDTLDSTVVLSSDPIAHDSQIGFYPLSADLVAALLKVGTGIHVSTLIFASTVAAGAVVLPAGVYALCFRLAPTQPMVAGFAAVASVLPARMYTIESTGRITAVIGLALIPGAVAAILDPRERRGWRTAVITAVVIFATATVHTSETAIVAGVVVVALVADALRSAGWMRVAIRFGWVLLGVAAGVVSLVALVPGISQASTQRADWFVGSTGGGQTLPIAIGDLVKLPVGPVRVLSTPLHVWSIAALVGCVIAMLPRWRRFAPVGISYLGFGSFYVLWLAGNLGPFVSLANPWYRNAVRIEWDLYALGAIPVGVAMHAIFIGLRRVAAWRPTQPATPTRHWTATVVAAVAVLLAGFLAMRPPVLAASEFQKRLSSPAGPDSRAAWHYLAAHVRPGQRVLDDLEAHGDLWVYADFGVPTLFGNPPLIGAASDSWKERLYLRGELRHIRTDPCVSDLINMFDVGYVFYSVNRIHGSYEQVSLALLQNRHYFDEVFHEGSAWVFRIRPIASRTGCDVRATNTKYRWDTPADAR
jgi:uncharacterized protein DUF6541